VSISGTAVVGSVLTASNNIADADGLGTFAYQWNRSGSTISGATLSTYTLVSADLANTITVTITYTDGKGFIETATSTATASVTIPHELITLTASMGDGSGDDTRGYYVGGFSDGNKMYVAPKSTETALPWGSAYISRGTTFVNDGLSNTNTLYAFGNSITTGHPAAYYAKNLTTGGYNTWYMPAKNELITIYSNKSKTPFASANSLTAYYWASTEVNNASAGVVGLDGGQWGWYVKTRGGYKIRAVRRSIV
jgi:hypothetical protein